MVSQLLNTLDRAHFDAVIAHEQALPLPRHVLVFLARLGARLRLVTQYRELVAGTIDFTGTPC